MKFTLCTALVTAFVFLSSLPAYAYLDPGTGSLIFQGVIAAVSAILITGRIYWTRIRSWFQGPSADEGGTASSLSDEAVDTQRE